MTEMLKRVRT